MATKSDKGPATVDQLFVLGLDENGKPRGARFAELKDNIASAATDMNCRVLVNQPETVSDIAMKLPVGRIYARGKAFIPNIKRDLYDKLLAAIGSCKEGHDHSHVEGTAASSATPAPAEAGPILPPLASGLPQNWESIATGNMILIDAGPGE